MPHKILLSLVLLSSLLLPNMACGQTDEQKKLKEDSGEQMHFVIVSKTHFDIGYSALARDVEHEYRTTMIDRALATIEAHGKGAEGGPGYVWTVPGWPMRTILWKGQHPERRKRIEAALRRGNLVLHALPYTMHTATSDVETLARSFIHADSVAREYGLDFPISAKMTDVPGHDWIIPTLLAHAGVKAVIVKSVNRIFFRSCINQGLPLIVHPQAVVDYKSGDMVEVDLISGRIEINLKGYLFAPLPDTLLKIILNKGLVNWIRES